MRQIGSGQPIWWRASQSPAPSAASAPISSTAAARVRRPIVARRTRRRSSLKSLLPAVALAISSAVAVLFAAASGKPPPPIQPALAEIERALDVAGFGLTQISLTGQRFTPDSDVFDAIDLAGTPTLLSFDSRAAQERVERLPWVERASIARVFPDRIEVHITERAPVAVWQLGPRHYLIDKAGRVLAAVAPGAALSLPRVAGKGAGAEAARLYSLLAGNPELMRRVEVAERVGERRWMLRLAGGDAVELPADELAEVEALGRAEQLIVSAARIGAGDIDLRVPGRALLRQSTQDRQGVGRPLDTGTATGGT